MGNMLNFQRAKKDKKIDFLHLFWIIKFFPEQNKKLKSLKLKIMNIFFGQNISLKLDLKYIMSFKQEFVDSSSTITDLFSTEDKNIENQLNYILKKISKVFHKKLDDFIEFEHDKLIRRKSKKAIKSWHSEYTKKSG